MRKIWRTIDKEVMVEEQKVEELLTIYEVYKEVLILKPLFF